MACAASGQSSSTSMDTLTENLNPHWQALSESWNSVFTVRAGSSELSPHTWSFWSPPPHPLFRVKVLSCFFFGLFFLLFFSSANQEQSECKGDTLLHVSWQCRAISVPLMPRQLQGNCPPSVFRHAFSNKHTPHTIAVQHVKREQSQFSLCPHEEPVSHTRVQCTRAAFRVNHNCSGVHLYQVCFFHGQRKVTYPWTTLRTVFGEIFASTRVLINVSTGSGKILFR